jgi:lycopene beta-cyclase
MDFTTGQQAGTTFFYVMPLSTTRALVEYTLFTEQLLEQQAYEQALREYIQSALVINNFDIIHEEFGVIPMTNHVFPTSEGRIIHIGIAGGQAKGSSGYAFRFIQKKTAAIVESLINNGHPFAGTGLQDKKFHLYDSVLLQVLQQKRMPGDKIFSAIFRKNDIQCILRFLDNESTIREDLMVMRSVPMQIFLPAALRQLFC